MLPTDICASNAEFCVQAQQMDAIGVINSGFTLQASWSFSLVSCDSVSLATASVGGEFRMADGSIASVVPSALATCCK